MRIGKLFEFENAHIVRFCSSKRCKTSIHGHSYKLELILYANTLDKAGMVYDFGLLKGNIKQIIDAFDHSTCVYKYDDLEYVNDIKKHSARWVELPCNISAENLSIVFFILISKILQNSKMHNDENVRVDKIRLNETRTGWAECEYDDAFYNDEPRINLNEITFSKAILEDFSDTNLFEKIKNNEIFINPKEV
ncbi:6-carboxytetrahydropterin synthase [Campylobacter sp. RM12651]|uniref:6-pyruvoyl trahydropterin synthase family protein n=1 Tax=Campylobacter sp. RM12651 TaxID=1660079 RepID=UPI001EFBE44F|nr:6-carboxytetrahydropterin synthase [Campylobacter sp. RM12651]ULO04179.1 6-carboxy-5,6,7,8-tetrahydropterin synthase [Campylobacter sp. RM12651]